MGQAEEQIPGAARAARTDIAPLACTLRVLTLLQDSLDPRSGESAFTPLNRTLSDAAPAVSSCDYPVRIQATRHLPISLQRDSRPAAHWGFCVLGDHEIVVY
jgi:hypothetical protein